MSAEKHAQLSASGSAKWLSCPAALALEAVIPGEDSGGPWAREGTAAHLILESVLSGGRELSSFLDQAIQVRDTVDGKSGLHNVPVTQDMINAVEIAAEYVGRLQAVNSFFEEKVDYSHIAPHGFGTADVILEVYEKVAPGKRVNTLYVCDYKHGAGVKVDAYENSQGLLYALGALNSLDMFFERPIERVIVVILQPRIDNISEYEISMQDLMSWGESIKPKAQRAYELYESVKNNEAGLFEPENFNPTKKGCQWCKGARAKKCRAYAELGFSAAVDGFEDLTAGAKKDLSKIAVTKDNIRVPALLTTAELAAIYKNMSLFLSFSKGLNLEIEKRILAGEQVPGLALVDTEKPRSWSLDEEDTIKALRTAGLQKKHYEKIGLISPTEAEKLLKKVKPNDYKRRYARLEATAVHREPGASKIIEVNTAPAEAVDDLLS